MQAWRTNLIDLADQNPPFFDNEEPVKSFDDLERELILCEDPAIEQGGTVPLNSVVGLDRQDTKSVSWKWMLRHQKRADSWRKLSESPDYYIDRDRYKENMQYTEVDGSYYLALGKHRNVIAKYLAHFNPEYYPEGPVIHNVTVYHYVVDYLLMNRLRLTKQLLQRKGLNHLSLSWEPAFRGSQKGKGLFRLYNPSVPYNEGLTFSKELFHELEKLISGSNIFNRRFLGSSEEQYLYKRAR